MVDPAGFLALALRLLAARALTFLALLMTFGVFCWAIWMQTVLSAVTATVFGGVIFLPVLFAGRPKGGQHAEDQ